MDRRKLTGQVALGQTATPINGNGSLSQRRPVAMLPETFR